MRWYHFFFPYSYIKHLEKRIDLLGEESDEFIIDFNSRLSDIEQQVTLYKEEIEILKKYAYPIGEKNEIEQADDDFVDVTEDYRIPIVDGINVMQEGQDPTQASPMKIYGPGSVQPSTYASTRPRSGQRKKKINA